MEKNIDPEIHGRNRKQKQPTTVEARNVVQVKYGTSATIEGKTKLPKSNNRPASRSSRADSAQQIKQNMVKTAVQYVRSATDSPESIRDQLKQTAKYAAENGYKIVGESFVDNGFSGLETKNRPAFTRMLNEIQNGEASYRYVLMVDISRLGRFTNPNEAGYYELLFNKHGVKLVYTSASAGFGFSSANAFLRKLRRTMASEHSRSDSHVTLRGMRAATQKGFWTSAAPYGYQRAEVDSSKHITKILPNGELARRGYHLTLVPGDKKEIKVVRRLFDWSRRAIGTGRIAAKLNSQRIPSPTGKEWCSSTVNHILRNPAYIGTLVWGKLKRGKFTREADTLGVANSTNHLRNEQDWIIVEDAFPALIDKDTFILVQKELNERKNKNSSVRDH